MVRQVILLFCLALMWLPIFFGVDSAQAATILNPTNLVAFQQPKAGELKTNSSEKPRLKYPKDLEHSPTNDIVFPKLEVYDPTVIADGYFTGKAVGYKAGKAVKDYSCNNFDLKCSARR